MKSPEYRIFEVDKYGNGFFVKSFLANEGNAKRYLENLQKDNPDVEYRMEVA